MQTVSTQLDLSTTKTLWFEQHRKDLLAAGKIEELRQTYKDQRESFLDENTGKFWDQKFSEPEYSHPMADWRIKQVIKNIDPKKSLLNLGVGRGKLEALLYKKYPKLKYTGTDITRKTLKNLQKEYSSWKFQYAELAQLPFPKESFDQVFLLEVLQHIKPSETFKILGELSRVLKTNGRAIISVPVNEGLDQMLPVNPNSQMRMYSKKMFCFELEEAGLHVQKVLEVSAFSKNFGFKQVMNEIFHFRQPNNLIAICQKK